MPLKNISSCLYMHPNNMCIFQALTGLQCVSSANLHLQSVLQGHFTAAVGHALTCLCTVVLHAASSAHVLFSTKQNHILHVLQHVRMQCYTL
jgi:hypothetical protein